MWKRSSMPNPRKLWEGAFLSAIFLPHFSELSITHITVINGEDADGFSLRHVPPAFGSSHLVFEKQKWFIDLFLDYSGGFTFNQLAPSEQDKPHLYAEDENGNPWSPSWWTLNIKSNYRVNDYFSLNGGIENIFDKRYRPYSSGIVAPGINFKLSAMLTF